MPAYYLFRVDDLCPTQDRVLWNRLKELFLSLDVKPILSVIPDCRDPHLHLDAPQQDFWEELHRLVSEGWSIGQHGFQHLYLNKNAGLLGITPRSEFAGLSFEAQKDKLLAGKKILEGHGIFTDLFVAPAHSFDRNTLKALTNCGFKRLSDGLALYPFWKENLLWIPQLLWEPVEMPCGLHTICLHPQFMSEECFQKVERFCRQQRNRIFDLEMACSWWMEQRGWKRMLYGALRPPFSPLWRLNRWARR